MTNGPDMEDVVCGRHWVHMGCQQYLTKGFCCTALWLGQIQQLERHIGASAGTDIDLSWPYRQSRIGSLISMPVCQRTTVKSFHSCSNFILK